ncbi:hypothetical protein D3C71_1177020 [compost metagenome]
MLTLAQCAEVAGALEDHQLILVGAGVEVVVQAKARKAEVAPGLRPHLVLAVVEVRAAVADVARALRCHLVDQHRLLLVQAQVEEHGLERQLFGAPQGTVGAPADVAHLVVVEFGEVGGELVAGCAIGLLRPFPGDAGDAVEIEALGLCGACQQGGGQRYRGLWEAAGEA